MKEETPRVIEESPLNVKNRDKKFAYRWVTKNQVEYKKSQGWQVVTKQNDKVKPNSDTNSENPIMHKTLVLMRMPIEKYQARRKKIQERVQEQLQAIRRNEEETAARAGVKIIR